MTNVNKAVVIVSGGMDSSTLLYYVMKTLRKQVVATLSFYYGQTHARELDSAKLISAKLKIPNIVIDLSLIMRDFKSALTGKSDVPEGHYAQDNMKQTVVPNRNSIMLSIAVGYAISNGANEVYFGPHAGDHAIYPDCRREFVSAFNSAMVIGNEWTPISVNAPFLFMTKGDIVKLGYSLGVPYKLTWTCYKGGDKACGKCGTCVERLEAFDFAGVKDPIEYEDREYWKKVVGAKWQ
jgi:7-cyano-7-deazaguanine synthase